MESFEAGAVVAMCLLVACGPAISDPPVAGTEGGSGSTTATPTSTSEDTPGSDASTTSHAGTSTSTSTGGEETSGSSSSSGNPEPPVPRACVDPAPGIVVEQAQGPDGPLDLATGELLTDRCGDGVALQFRTSSSVTLFRCFLPNAPLDGTFDCETDEPEPALTVQTYRPFVDPDPGVATDGLYLRARVVGSGEGWDIALDVELPDCGEATCSCPCD